MWSVHPFVVTGVLLVDIIDLTDPSVLGGFLMLES